MKLFFNYLFIIYSFRHLGVPTEKKYQLCIPYGSFCLFLFIYLFIIFYINLCIPLIGWSNREKIYFACISNNETLTYVCFSILIFIFILLQNEWSLNKTDFGGFHLHLLIYNRTNFSWLFWLIILYFNFFCAKRICMSSFFWCNQCILLYIYNVYIVFFSQMYHFYLFRKYVL